MIVYAETSAVLRWILGAPRGDEVYDCLHRASGIAASRFVVVEVRRVLARFEATGDLAPKLASVCRTQLADELARWDLLELSEPIWVRAEERFPVEPLRTVDALHLASALHYQTASAEISMLSFDRRILENCKRLSMPVALSVGR